MNPFQPVTVSVPGIELWKSQVRSYVPAFAGAVKAAWAPPATVTSTSVPLTLTVWVAESWFLTVTMAPAVTVSSENLNEAMVIVGPAAAVDCEDADVTAGTATWFELEHPALTARAIAASARPSELL